MTVILILVMALAVGALIGLIPFFVGRYMRKPELGQLGLILCTLSGLMGLSLFVAIGFTIAIFTTREDIHIRSRNTPAAPIGPVYAAAPTRMEVHCLSGPLKGQVYTVGPAGAVLGREGDCQIRFPANAPGISRHHCQLSWNGNGALLTDLGSTYGTFLPGGYQLAANQPTPLNAGDRFLLSSSGYLFQIFIR